jgi:hypothetical protein
MVQKQAEKSLDNSATPIILKGHSHEIVDRLFCIIWSSIMRIQERQEADGEDEESSKDDMPGLVTADHIMDGNESERN